MLNTNIKTNTNGYVYPENKAIKKSYNDSSNYFQFFDTIRVFYFYLLL
jgi:hypothetical protein